ncbi:hypothetical protein UlMin_035589 [Ulmus minor]
MASISRSRRNFEARSGGKILRPRRSAARRTPYERPSFSNPDPENPSWLSKIIFSPTRMIASGAGKLITSVFSQESSSSDADSSSEDIEDDSDDDVSAKETEVLKEDNGTSEPIRFVRKNAQLAAGKRNTKRVIEVLLMQETFTRDECNKLIKIIKSRVVDSSNESAEKDKLTETPEGTNGEADEHGLRCTAVMEARKWLTEKKLGSASKSDLDNVIEDEVGSPVDMAKLYMRTRPRWASPSFNHGELKSSSPISAHLFKETPYSVGGNSTSSFKAKKDTPTSGSWNIQEEIQRVRAKATEEMLRTLPSKKLDLSSFAFENRSSPIWDSSLHKVTGRYATERFQNVEMTPYRLQNEASSLDQVDFISGLNQDLETTHNIDGEGGKKDVLEDVVCKEHGLQSSQDIEAVSLRDSGVDVVQDHTDTNATDQKAEQSTEVPDPKSHEMNASTSKEETGKQSAYKSNGFPSSGHR